MDSFPVQLALLFILFWGLSFQPSVEILVRLSEEFGHLLLRQPKQSHPILFVELGHLLYGC